MIEKKLKQLQKVSATDAAKNIDWEKIEQKNRKQQNFYWKEIGAVITVLAIAFTLAFLNNKSTEKQATDRFAEIETIYFSNRKPLVGNFEPKSNYYPFVHKFEGERLDAMTEKLKASTWQPIEDTLEGSYVTYKFVFADGTSKIVRNYIDETSDYTEYLYEEKTGYAYVLKPDSFGETIQSDVMKFLLNVGVNTRMIALFLLISIGILFLIKNYRYKKETGIQKLPNRYVNKRQEIAQMAIIPLLLGSTLITQNVHYVWWIIGLIVNIWLFRVFDDQSEHYHWRVVDDFLRNILVLVFATNFYYLF